MPSNRLPFLLLLLCSISTFLSCTNYDEQNKGKTVFRYNESADITSLDPAFARDLSRIWACNQLFSGLVQLDDSLRVQPCIAKSWAITNGGKTYTFQLRQDVFFHTDQCFKDKKRKVIASDFVYSLNRLINEKTASPGAWVMNSVQRKTDQTLNITAINDSTLTIQLQNAFPPFLSLLGMSYCSVLPKEAIDMYGLDFRKHPVGTGPFMFKYWKEGQKLVFVKNPDYFETMHGKKLPFLDAIAISFIVDKQTAFLEFVKGNFDFLSGIDPGYKDMLLTKQGTLNSRYAGKFNIQRLPYLNTEYLGIYMQTDKLSPLASKQIRQAINYGFDRKKMIRYLRNNIGIAGEYGMVPFGLPGYDPKQVNGFKHDPAKARKLLEEAGFPNGKGLPEITVYTNPSYLDVCKFMQHQLQEIGIQIKIDVSPPGTLRDLIAKSKAPFFRGSWIADYPDAENYLSLFYSPNKCPNGPNYTHYSNATFDRLYVKSLQEINDSLRNKLYLEMDNLLIQEAPVVVLYYDEVLRFTRKNISGMGCNGMNMLTLKAVVKD